MTAFDVLLYLLALIGILCLLDRFLRPKRLQSFRGDDGPIRVKGGSVFVEALEEWSEDPDEGEWRPKRRSNFWRVSVTEDGVPKTPVNGRRVEIDMVGRVGGPIVTKTVVFKAKGTIRINDKDSLKKLPGSGDKHLTHKDAEAFMQEIRVEPGGHRFGPYTADQSKRVVADLEPLQ